MNFYYLLINAFLLFGFTACQSTFDPPCPLNMCAAPDPSKNWCYNPTFDANGCEVGCGYVECPPCLPEDCSATYTATVDPTLQVKRQVEGAPVFCGPGTCAWSFATNQCEYQWDDCSNGQDCSTYFCPSGTHCEMVNDICMDPYPLGAPQQYPVDPVPPCQNSQFPTCVSDNPSGSCENQKCAPGYHCEILQSCPEVLPPEPLPVDPVPGELPVKRQNNPGYYPFPCEDFPTCVPDVRNDCSVVECAPGYTCEIETMCYAPGPLPGPDPYTDPYTVNAVNRQAGPSDPIACPDIICTAQFCEFGRGVDAFGCETCECNAPPSCETYPVCVAKNPETCVCDASLQMGAPARLCPDGINWEGPGGCEVLPDGTCGWSWKTCPSGCDNVKCGKGQICVEDPRIVCVTEPCNRAICIEPKCSEDSGCAPGETCDAFSGECVPYLTCASILCAWGYECVEYGNGKSECVPTPCVGQEVKFDGCNTCYCQMSADGFPNWACTEMACPPPPETCTSSFTKSGDGKCSICACDAAGLQRCADIPCECEAPGATKPFESDCNGNVRECKCTNDLRWNCPQYQVCKETDVVFVVKINIELVGDKLADYSEENIRKLIQDKFGKNVDVSVSHTTDSQIEISIIVRDGTNNSVDKTNLQTELESAGFQVNSVETATKKTEEQSENSGNILLSFSQLFVASFFMVLLF